MFQNILWIVVNSFLWGWHWFCSLLLWCGAAESKLGHFCRRMHFDRIRRWFECFRRLTARCQLPWGNSSYCCYLKFINDYIEQKMVFLLHLGHLSSLAYDSASAAECAIENVHLENWSLVSCLHSLWYFACTTNTLHLVRASYSLLLDFQADSFVFLLSIFSARYPDQYWAFESSSTTHGLPVDFDCLHQSTKIALPADFDNSDCRFDFVVSIAYWRF